MSDQTTQLDDPRTRRGGGSTDGARVAALVILASRAEPERVGETWLPPQGRRAGLLGRLEPDEVEGHVGWVRQRPGTNTPTGPLTSPAISRTQLRIADAGRCRLSVENVGRRTLLVDGTPATQETVRPGALLELEHELLLLVVERPRTMATLRWTSVAPGHGFGKPDAYGLVGESEAAWLMRDELAFVAASTGHVLIMGPSGTGKELAAQAIHGSSTRREGAYVARNAATLPETLIDAELFGNAKNFPNPGMAHRRGLVGEADGGTLFLDEAAELPHAMQTHLLRVLDTAGEYQQLGDATVRRSDLRLIAATNRDLDDMRADFAARFEHHLALPDLGDRREDVALLLRHLFSERLRTEPDLHHRFVSSQTDAPRWSFGLVSSLALRPPRTNVRGLAQALRRSVMESRDDVLGPIEWTSSDEAPVEPERPERPADDPAWTPPGPDEIQACLDKHDGVQGPVWRELGFRNRYQLQRLIRKHGLRTAANTDGSE